MAQIDGLGSAIALKSNDLFMVNQNIKSDAVPAVRLEKSLPLSDLMAYINANFDPLTNKNPTYFCKKESISGTCTISAGPSGITYSGNRYVGILGIIEPVSVCVSLTSTAFPTVTYQSRGFLIRSDYSSYCFVGQGGLGIDMYTPSTPPIIPRPVLDMTSLITSFAPGDISYTVEVYHSKSSSISLALHDASITASSRLPAYTVFSTKKTTIEYPGTLPQTPDSDVLYML